MELKSIFERYGLGKGHLAEFHDQFTFLQLEPGETVFEEDAESDAFYFIKSGELAVYRSDSGRQESVLNVLGTGEFFGEIGLLNNIPRTASIRALSHAQLYVLAKSEFHELMSQSPTFSKLIDQIHIQRLLQGIPVFQNLSASALRRVRQGMELREVNANEPLAKQGEPVSEMFVILQGNARQFTESADGYERPLGRLHPGGYFGEQGLLGQTKHACSVALEQPGKVLSLSRNRFRALLRHTPALAFNMPGSGLLTKLLPFFYNKQAYLAVPELSMNQPRRMIGLMGLITAALLAVAILPSLWPQSFSALHGLAVDTDPENMLAADEPARQVHNHMKAQMNLRDMVVVGIVNETHPDGVFNVDSLGRIHTLTEFAKTLRWPDDAQPGRMRGVEAVDILAPSTVDVVEQAGLGSVSFSWLMPTPPTTAEQVQAVRERLQRYPSLNGTLISDDGKAISLFLPLSSKDVSYRVYEALRERAAQFDGNDQFLIAGLPVAEDAFGVEMFVQMAISAPLAMLVIFALLYLFFRNVTLIAAPMVVAMVAVLCTMALLVASGNTLHIMSSMIPIFIMPIAVLDSVHILSEFFDYYPRLRDRRLTLEHVMRELFAPMLFTSLTTAVGFASLALVPIPPVQVFGIFIALGVLLAWLLSISFIPAYVMLISQRRLDAIVGQTQHATDVASGAPSSPTDRLLQALRGNAQRRSGRTLLITLLAVVACVYGVSRIVVNDNPVRWFAAEHPIRVADTLMNEHFAGTYIAYLGLKAEAGQAGDPATQIRQLIDELNADNISADSEAMRNLSSLVERLKTDQHPAPLKALQNHSLDQLDAAPDEQVVFWQALSDELEQISQSRQLFKRPEVLRYIERLQGALARTGIVGKSVSVADMAKTVNRELRGGDEQHYRVPTTEPGVAQALLTYQSGHRPQDLWHFVTPDYRQASIWLLLNSGDNQEMSQVVDAVQDFMADNPPPVALQSEWFGLTYINVIWQQKMVSGMLLSIAGSFLTVLLMMVFLLRSARWGLLAMVPLSATMLVIYGLLGLSGKPYDMPVAVLSALTIGLAVDFTIHFLVRTRHFYSQAGSWEQALKAMFGEPARAIMRNILVVAIGFLPLLAASLVPYNTVGTLIAAILLCSGVATLVVIAAALQHWQGRFFPRVDVRRTTVFGCPDALFASVVGAALLLVSLRPVLGLEWPQASWIGLAIAVLLLLALRSCHNKRTEQRRPPPK